MPDEVVQPPAPELMKADDIDIADFITASHGVDEISKSHIAIGHKNDFFTIQVTQKAADHLKVPLKELVVRFDFYTTKDGQIKTQTKNYDMDYQVPPFTLTNTEEAGGADINNYARIVEVARKEGETISPAGGNVNKEPAKAGSDLSWLWWTLGILAVAVFAAIVWRYFLAGRDIGGVKLPGPFIKGKGQAPGAAAVTPAAPAPAAVVVNTAPAPAGVQ